jgi:hypothetical protein
MLDARAVLAARRAARRATAEDRPAFLGADRLPDSASARSMAAIMGSLLSVLPLVEAGKVKVLAVSNKQRAPLLPEIPTAIEAGFPDLAFEGLAGFFGSRDVPADRQNRIAADVRLLGGSRSGGAIGSWSGFVGGVADMCTFPLLEFAQPTPT